MEIEPDSYSLEDKKILLNHFIKAHPYDSFRKFLSIKKKETSKYFYFNLSDINV